MRQALSVASECAPLVKTGGLADVVGALPAALAPEGWTLRTLLPGYPAVMAALGEAVQVWHTPDLFGGPGRVLAATAAGLDLLVLDAPHLFARDGSIYLGPDGRDWPDNPERFAALCWAAASIATHGADGWRPEVVHMHDWQAGLVPVYLAETGGRAGTLLTVHNIAFHGLAPSWRLAGLHLPAHRFNPDGFEFYGQISALKAGLVMSTKISTVSPTYAEELMTPEFGMAMDGIIRARRADLAGILNGIDDVAWDPATDPAIIPFTAASGKAASGKARNRAALRAEFGLPEADGPLAIVVSRLTGQKGLDLLLHAAGALTTRGGQIALLGSGEQYLETAWRQAAERDPAIAVRIGYDEALSHRMFAGADAVLVPSRFEPCGLTQLYGLRYGAIPVVALTGGLADSVVPANDAGLRAGVANGIQFHPVTTEALRGALARLADLFADRKAWAQMQKNAMRHPVGWAASAPRYAALYGAVAASS
jgi:starch synthase